VGALRKFESNFEAWQVGGVGQSFMASLGELVPRGRAAITNHGAQAGALCGGWIGRRSVRHDGLGAAGAPGYRIDHADDDCPLAVNVVCWFAPIAPYLDGDVDLTQQGGQPALVPSPQPWLDQRPEPAHDALVP
jgi:hypothetical protein